MTPALAGRFLSTVPLRKSHLPPFKHVSIALPRDAGMCDNFMDIRNLTCKFPWVANPLQELPHYSNWVTRLKYNK